MQMASVKIGVDTDYAVRVRAQKAACCSAAAALLLLLCCCGCCCYCCYPSLALQRGVRAAVRARALLQVRHAVGAVGALRSSTACAVRGC
jgi:hypothetical protein